MASLTFSDVKIEKLLGIPESPVPNRFYLIETAGATPQLFLSDSKGNLYLLNEGFIREINVNKTEDYGILMTDDRTVFNEANAGKSVTFYLPCLQDGLEYSFSIHDETLRVASTCSEQFYLGDVLVDTNEVIESSYPGSFVLFRAIENKWVARYITGQWDVLTVEYIDGLNATSELAQIVDGGNSLSEYTNIVDGGGA